MKVQGKGVRAGQSVLRFVISLDISSPVFEIPRTWMRSRNLLQSNFLDQLWGKTHTAEMTSVRTFAACAQFRVCSVFRTREAQSSLVLNLAPFLSQECTAQSAGGGDRRQTQASLVWHDSVH